MPNVTLLVVVAWSFHRGPNEGVVWGLIGGLAIDLASGSPTGITPLPLMIAALVVGVGRGRIYSSNIVLPALVSLFAIGLYQAIWLLLLAIVGQPISWRLGIVQVGVPLLFLNLALMPVFYVAMSWLARLVQGSRVRLG